MKFIAVSQRVEIIKEYDERRDCLDQNWYIFLLQCGLVPLLLPNNKDIAEYFVTKFNIRGILLTGGNSLCKYGGDAPERDELEEYCLKVSLKKNIPLLGVCRGMQVIQDFFGIKLQKVDGHVKNKQSIYINNKIEEVNSYHTWGATESAKELKTIAFSNDGIIKGIEHKTKKIKGIMWHPERIKPFSDRDISIFTDFFT